MDTSFRLADGMSILYFINPSHRFHNGSTSGLSTFRTVVGVRVRDAFLVCQPLQLAFTYTPSAALKTIMNGGPHASQFSSVLFRHKLYTLLSNHPNVKVHMSWTPGHRGALGTALADKNAKRGSKNKSKSEALVSGPTK